MTELEALDREALALIRRYVDLGEYALLVRSVGETKNQVCVICPQFEMAKVATYLAAAAERMFDGPDTVQ